MRPFQEPNFPKNKVGCLWEHPPPIPKILQGFLKCGLLLVGKLERSNKDPAPCDLYRYHHLSSSVPITAQLWPLYLRFVALRISFRSMNRSNSASNSSAVATALHSGEDLSAGAKAGIAIAAVAVVVLITAAAFLLFRRKRQLRHDYQVSSDGDTETSKPPKPRSPLQTVRDNQRPQPILVAAPVTPAQAVEAADAPTIMTQHQPTLASQGVERLDNPGSNSPLPPRAPDSQESTAICAGREPSYRPYIAVSLHLFVSICVASSG